MSWSAVLPGAAVRMPRTAAGWRALRVALLVGGALVVGLLCGERAYAADGVRALTDGPAGWVAGEQWPMDRPDAHVRVGRVGPDGHARELRQWPDERVAAGWVGPDGHVGESRQGPAAHAAREPRQWSDAHLPTGRVGPDGHAGESWQWSDARVPVGRVGPDAHAREPRQRPAAHAPAGWVDSRGPRSVSGVGGVPLAGVDAGAVGERVVRVAGDTGEAVRKGLGEAQAKEPSSSLPLPKLPVPSELPALSDPPAAPKAPKSPKSPTLPDLSNLPALPKPPVLPDLQDLPNLPGSSDLPDLSGLPNLPGSSDLPDLSGLPNLPGSSDLPDLPDLPNLPGPSDLLRPPPPPPTGEITLPEVPGLPRSPSSPALPGHLPGRLPGRPLPAPVTAGPQPGRTAPSPVDESASVGRTGGVEFVAAGSDSMVCGAEHRAAGWTEHAGNAGPAEHAARSANVGHGSGGHAPTGRPDGALGNRSAADNGTSRHGDLHAVTLSERDPLRLLPGVAVRSCAAGTRDSHRDILVFPG